MKRAFPLAAYVALGLAALVPAAFGFWLRHELTSPYYGTAQAETFVEIPRGSRSDTIAEALVAGGILRSRLPFLLYLRWEDSAGRLKAGEYRFHRPLTPVEVADRLIRGDVYFISLTVPEGLTARETIDLVTRRGLGKREALEAALRRRDWIRDIDSAATNLEGFLFPETYRFERNVSAERILKSMVDQFRVRWEGLTRQHPVPAGWNARDIVTMASIIEKEAGHEEERPLVGSVLANRLQLGMPLACDPTIIYALKLSGSFDGNLRKADLALNSPYNSYLHAGLPPGPIANPGESSLRAALAPAQTSYLYFVSRNDGTHHFSSEYRAHAAAVARFQKQGARRKP